MENKNIKPNKKESELKNFSVHGNVGMSLRKTIEVLEYHNEWRRDNNIPPNKKMVHPKVLGEAIDNAIYELKKLMKQKRFS